MPGGRGWTRKVELSKRQLQVLALASKGLKAQEIADKLFLSRRTVEFHLASVFQLLDVTNRIAAIEEAKRSHGLTQDKIDELIAETVI